MFVGKGTKTPLVAVTQVDAGVGPGGRVGGAGVGPGVGAGAAAFGQHVHSAANAITVLIVDTMDFRSSRASLGI